MIAASPPPVPLVGVTLPLADGEADLSTRALVAAVVPAPRFGRESEAVATAGALADQGAELVDASLPPRLLGAVAAASRVPVAVRAQSADEAAAAARAGARVVLAPLALVPAVLVSTRGVSDDVTVAVVIDDLADLADARAVADHEQLALAVDATRWTGPEAMGREAAAIGEGCRIVCTNDVRRSRRVAEVMAAILAARRATDAPAPARRTTDAPAPAGGAADASTVTSGAARPPTPASGATGAPPSDDESEP